MRDRLLERLTVVFRADPVVLREALARVHRGRFAPVERNGLGLVHLAYSRLTSAHGRWWPGPRRHAELLTAGVPVEARRGGRRGVVLLAQLRSGGPLGRLGAGARTATFVLDEPQGVLDLEVREGEHRLLHLRARPCPELQGSTFLSARAAADHLARASFQTPRGALRVPRDARLLSGGRRALEPLAAFELEAPLLAELGLGEAELDSAFRLTRVRRQLAPHVLPAPGASEGRAFCAPGA